MNDTVADILGMTRLGKRENSSEPLPDQGATHVPIDEAIMLGAADSEFYSRVFFPKTFRFPSPRMHRAVWRDLEDPAARMVLAMMFRGSAKTTLLRTYMSKRIAYRLSHVALWIGANESSASRSVGWLRKQVEFNALYRDTFGLVPGRKWGDTELEIRNKFTDDTVWIKGVGINASIRGINFDDYRPDTIVLDDVVDDENATTDEGREKLSDLILGAVARSLISEVESPNAKLAMLQTPLHSEDAAALASTAPGWRTNIFPCWTPETAELDVSLQESSWPELFPTETLRRDKENAIEMGKLHVFLREMECKLVSPGTAAFVTNQLQFYDDPDAGRGGTTVIAIDPVPPASPREVAKNLHEKNYEAIAVVSRRGGNYYLLHYEMMRGHNPDWTMAKIFELSYRFNCVNVSIELIAYQRTLKWLLEKEMSRRQKWLTIMEDDTVGRMAKYHKIVDTIRPLLNNRRLFVKKSQTEFISHITQYPKTQYDDLLDATAQGLRQLTSPSLELGAGEYSTLDESAYDPIDYSLYSRAP